MGDEQERVSGEPSLETDYAKVRTTTLELLNKGEFEESLAWSRRLIELKPDRAFGYRCLGSGLQDLGRIDEALEVYGQCVDNATKGEVFECSALGGGGKSKK